jgi:hypothetical protein
MVPSFGRYNPKAPLLDFHVGTRITNGPVASTLVVYAKTSPEKGSKGITAFIIERGFKVRNEG